jgi:hypothetical protein
MTPPKERHLADREWVGVADPLFEKTAPLDPPQKLLIKGGHGLQLKRIYANHDRLWFV